MQLDSENNTAAPHRVRTALKSKELSEFDVKDIFELTDYVLKNTEYRKPFPKINDVLCLRIWKTVDDFADFCKEYLSFMKKWDPEEYTKMKQPDSNLYQLIVRLKDQEITGAKKLYFDYQLNII